MTPNPSCPPPTAPSPLCCICRHCILVSDRHRRTPSAHTHTRRFSTRTQPPLLAANPRKMRTHSHPGTRLAVHTLLPTDLHRWPLQLLLPRTAVAASALSLAGSKTARRRQTPPALTQTHTHTHHTAHTRAYDCTSRYSRGGARSRIHMLAWLVPRGLRYYCGALLLRFALSQYCSTCRQVQGGGGGGRRWGKLAWLQPSTWSAPHPAAAPRLSTFPPFAGRHAPFRGCKQPNQQCTRRTKPLTAQIKAKPDRSLKLVRPARLGRGASGAARRASPTKGGRRNTQA